MKVMIWRSWFGLIVLGVVMYALLTACATEPIWVAKNSQARADAMYADIVIGQKTILRLLAEPSIPNAVKLKLQAADATIHPIADQIDLASANVTHLKVTSPEDVPAALQALDEILTRAGPLIMTFTAQITAATQPQPKEATQ